MLVKYDTLPQVLAAAYPAVSWELSAFAEVEKVPKGYLSSVENQREYVSRVGEKALGIKEVKHLPWLISAPFLPSTFVVIAIGLV